MEWSKENDNQNSCPRSLISFSPFPFLSFLNPMNLRFFFSPFSWRWILNSSPSTPSILSSTSPNLLQSLPFSFFLFFFLLLFPLPGWNLASAISFVLAGRSVVAPSGRSILVRLSPSLFLPSSFSFSCCFTTTSF